MCNHIIFLLWYFCSSMLIRLFLLSFLLLMINRFLHFALGGIYLKLNLGKNLFFSAMFCDFSWVPFYWISIVLFLFEWHQHFSLLMLDYCSGYQWIRAEHSANQYILKCSYVMIHIVIQVFNSQWSTYVSPLIYNTKTIITNTPQEIHHVYTTQKIQHEKKKKHKN